MNWYSNVVPPKIKALIKREAPENLWVKCPESGQLVFHKDIEANLFVVPGSGYHMRCPVDVRLATLFDNGELELLPTPEAPVDPLKFRDIKRYVDKLKEYRLKTGQQDAVTLATGKLDGSQVTVAVQDFEFLGGSLGMAAGEAIVAGAEHALAKRTPFIIFTASGGARMQEGMFSLMQMPRTTIARAAPARRATALYRRADQSHDRRRHGVLRHARRRADRGARRDHRLRGRARHRTDDPRKAARGIPARGISARSRHGGYGGAAAGDARDARAALRPSHQIAAAPRRLNDRRGRHGSA